jgi:hypothetical protein
MTAQIQNFQLANNEDWDAVFTLKANDGTPVVLGAGIKVHLQVRTKASDPNVVFEASLDNGYFRVTNADTSEVTLNVHGSKMRSISPAGYVYDLLVENPSGRVTRCYAGTIILDQGVTELVLQPQT